MVIKTKSTRYAGPDDPIYNGGVMVSTHRSGSRSGGSEVPAERRNPPAWIRGLDEYAQLPEAEKEALNVMPGFKVPSLHVYDDPAEQAEERERVRGLQLRHFREQVLEVKRLPATGR